MNKIKLFFIAIFFYAIRVYAQVPMMEKFAPSEFMTMNELSIAETKSFIENHRKIFDMCEEVNYKHIDGREYPEQKLILNDTKIFKQNVNNDVFYWILVPGVRSNFTRKLMENVSWFMEKQYFIGLVRVEGNEDRLLFLHPTFNIDWDEKSYHYSVRTYQIIKGKEKNKGIIFYDNKLRFTAKDQGMRFDRYYTTKEQPLGYITGVRYYLFENEPKETLYKDDSPGFMLENWKFISISASDFLWDLNNPLKYGLQNAFDQNKSTSYVENTEDDLMKIEIMAGPINKIYIVNGYAKNEKLYKENNRIIEIADEWNPESTYPQVLLSEKNERFLLKDNELNYQVIDLNNAQVKFSNGYLFISDITKGSKYNDTCISEINICLRTGNFVFGDIYD